MEIATLAVDLNVRAGVGTSYPIVHVARKGDKIVASREAGHSWFKVDHIQKLDGTTFLPAGAAYCSSWLDYYSSIEPYEPPVEPPPGGDKGIASIFKTEEIVVTYQDGTKDTFRKENFEIPKV